MKLIYSSRFTKSYKKLVKGNKQLEDKIIKTITTFQTSSTHLSLRLHKLKKYEYWSLSVNMTIRIIFEYNQNSVLLIDIGDHSIYD